VPAGIFGTFETYRIKLEPDFESILGKWAWGARIFKPLVPDCYFWLDAKPPHHLIRFTGKFGPEGAAPLQAWELTKVVATD